MSEPSREPEPMALPLVALGLVLSVLAWAALIGLAVARKGGANTVAMSATGLVFLPVMAAAMSSTRRRLTHIGWTMIVWSLALFASMPVYFPGERREALTTGLSMLTGNEDGDGVGRSIAGQIPDEPVLAVAQVPLAQEVVEQVRQPGGNVPDNAMVLPFEGDGRRISIPVVFRQGNKSVETFMMLDTGATYTTLPESVLATLGISPTEDAPRLNLNTANGKREAKVALVDSVWLGDLSIQAIAVTHCEDCASEDNKGLLGLNVTSGFNYTVDQERGEISFTARDMFNRVLDVQPYLDLQARFLRFPGGRVEVEMDFANQGNRQILSAAARVDCNNAKWLVQLDPTPPGASQTVRRRLPLHDRCVVYSIVLDAAQW